MIYASYAHDFKYTNNKQKYENRLQKNKNKMHLDPFYYDYLNPLICYKLNILCWCCLFHGVSEPGKISYRVHRRVNCSIYEHSKAHARKTIVQSNSGVDIYMFIPYSMPPPLQNSKAQFIPLSVRIYRFKA